MAEAAAPAAAAVAAVPAPPLRRLPAFDHDGLEPKVGDRIMVVHQPWLNKILDGDKTMELRSRRYRTGYAWLDLGGHIYGRVKIAEAVPLTTEEFRARAAEHCWPAEKEPPYKTMWGLLLVEVQQLPGPMPYWRPGCAIGWNVYRKQPEDLPMKSKANRKTTKVQKREPASPEHRDAEPAN